MTRFACIIGATAMTACAAATSAAASDAEKAAAIAAGAIAILGVAALAHHEHHYDEGWRPSNEHETAMFEAGYRDGLHGAEFDTGYRARAYSEGYSAGSQERDNGLAHRRHRADVQAGRRHALPDLARRACVGEVAGSFNVRPHDVHVVKFVKVNNRTYDIEAAVGRKHVICEAADDDVVGGMQTGRL